MQVKITRWRILGAVALLLAVAAAAVCTYAVHDYLYPKPVEPRLTVTPLSKLGADGVPFDGRHIWFENDGLPTEDGKALFWVGAQTANGWGWILLRLPDCRVLCETEGFNSFSWIAGEAALAQTVTPFPSSRLYRIPIWGKLFPTRIRSPKIDFWAVDWRTGKIRKETDKWMSNTSAWMDVSMGGIEVSKVPWVRGWTWRLPDAPESRSRNGDWLCQEQNPKTGKAYMTLRDWKTGAITQSCDFADNPVHTGPYCRVADDKAIVILQWVKGQDRAVMVNFSTGAVDEIPLTPK